MRLDCVRCGETFEDSAETFEFSTLLEPLCDECIYQEEGFGMPYRPPIEWKKAEVICCQCQKQFLEETYEGDDSPHLCDKCYKELSRMMLEEELERP
jgi:hypothetical protein